MAIELNDGARPNAPVIRLQRLGEVAQLAIVRTEQRDRLRRNFSTGEMEPMANGKDRQGRPRVKQEMVIHAIALPGTTMEARLGEEGGVPAPGDRVRVILKAKGFGDWIEARRLHRRGKLNVGDVLTLETRWAQQYDQDGNAKGGKIERQADADALPRHVTIGFYGPVRLREGSERRWIEAAEQAYRADETALRQQRAIPLESAEEGGDEFGDGEIPF
ncbi:MAG: hypothetical protein ACKOPT_15190 [Cyanobium sp.]